MVGPAMTERDQVDGQSGPASSICRASSPHIDPGRRILVRQQAERGLTLRSITSRCMSMTRD